MNVFTALLFLLFFILALVGASAATGQLVQKYVLSDIPDTFVLPLGFGLFPVWVTYGGFVGLWRIPFLVTFTGIVFSCYGLFYGYGYFSSVSRKWRGHGRLLFLCAAVPSAVILLLLWSKWAYLLGGVSDGDESLRSVILTGAFASNYLKPAFPLDFSLPIAYPYYLFQISAFLYSAAAGMPFPSVALFAVTLCAVVLSYRMLYLTCTFVFRSHVQERFFLLCLLLTASGFHGFNEQFGWIPFSRFQVQPLSGLMHSGYHYFWGVCGLALAASLLARFWALRERRDAMLSALFLALSFGYCGIPFAWAVFGLLVAVGGFAWQSRSPIKTLGIRGLLAIALIVALVLLPQFFGFLPRLSPTFYFSAPHFWFPRDASVNTAHFKGFLQILAKAGVGPVIMLVNIGPLLLMGFFAAPLLLFLFHRMNKADPEWHMLLPFLVTITMAWILLTFTSSGSGDWYGRGFIVPMVFSAFVATKLLSPVFQSGAWRAGASAIVCALLLVQAASVVVEHALKVAAPASESVRHFHTYPFGTIFLTKDFTQVNSDIILAGRATITPPPPPVMAYINHPDVLKRFGIGIQFAPCVSSIYGQSTPNGELVYLSGSGEQLGTCKNQ